VPQHHVQSPLPLAVKLAVPTVGVASGFACLYSFPQELKRDVLAALQLPMNRRAVRQATLLRRRDREEENRRRSSATSSRSVGNGQLQTAASKRSR